MNWIKALFIVVAVCFFSCSKELKDQEKPNIRISSPAQMQTIEGGDVVHIVGTITDNKQIERVTITLRDKNNTALLSTIIKTPDEAGTKNYALNCPYSFNDLQLASGQYDFNITAFDGENTTTIYVPIVYYEFERERKGVFIVSNSGSSSSVYVLDSTYNVSFHQAMNGDFIGAAVNSKNQQLIISSKTTGSVSAFDPQDKSEIWSSPFTGNPPTPFYTGFYFQNNTVFLGMRNGGVRRYDKNGTLDFFASTNNGFFMESAFIHNDTYFVMEEKPMVTGSASQLSLSWLYSGSTVQQTPIQADVKGMYSLTENKIILLANTTSPAAQLVFYDIITGGKTTPFNISSLGKIDACLEISNGLYLVAASGSLTHVDVHHFSTLGYLSGVQADNLWFDSFYNELYVAHGNTLRIYDYPSKTLKGSYTHSEAIEEVLFWYNK